MGMAAGRSAAMCFMVFVSVVALLTAGGCEHIRRGICVAEGYACPLKALAMAVRMFRRR